MFSHKFKSAGCDFEFGLSLAESKLVWIAGPFEASEPDLDIFCDRGPKKKLKRAAKKTQVRKMVIADKGHRGEPKRCSFANSLDKPEVSKFKSQTHFRQEKHNGMVKEFKATGADRHLHGMERYGDCVQAICVLLQCEMKNNKPLFDIQSSLLLEILVCH